MRYIELKISFCCCFRRGQGYKAASVKMALPSVGFVKNKSGSVVFCVESKRVSLACLPPGQVCVVIFAFIPRVLAGIFGV